MEGIDMMEPPVEPVADEQMGAPAMEMCVPLDTLKEPDEQQAMQMPEVGNNVVMTVEGTISRIEGTNAYITPSAVNGQKLDQPPSEPANEVDQLRGMATEMGNYQ